MSTLVNRRLRLSYNSSMTVNPPINFPIAGVVFAWAMPASGAGYELPLFEIADALEDPKLSIWLHLNLSNSQVQRWLEKPALFQSGLSK